MSYGNEYALDQGYERNEAISAERAAFIRKVYTHVAGAIGALIAIEVVLFSIPGLSQNLLQTMFASPGMQLAVFGGFILFGTLAQYWAASQTSRAMQYVGLSVYVVLEAIILFPLLFIANYYADMTGEKSLIPTAGIMTFAVFLGLTAVVFITKKDFSFLGSLLTICSFIALGVILAAVIFGGFSLGKFFCMAMIVLMAGYILYDTSNILLHYGTDQYVAASLALFASIATLFWYILRLLLILASDRN